MSGFAEAFRRVWKGPPVEASGQAALQAAIDQAVKEHPGLPTDWGSFAAAVAERANALKPAPEAIQALHLASLYLAWACGRGDPIALERFEAAYLAHAAKWISGLKPDDEMIEEVKQQLRQKLFLGGKIQQYSGEGTLENWLRTVALRTALNMLEGARAKKSDDELIEAGIAHYEPELDFIKQRYRDDFVQSFRASFQALPKRSRALLRFQHLERLTPERIGIIYGVHRTTAARWLAEAHQQVLDGTRAGLKSRLKLDSRECESLVELLKSRLALTLTSLFESTAGP